MGALPVLVLALVVGASAAVARAQITNMDVNSDLPYSFLPPGARSAGLGGAFTAIADDATAAYSNPAGLLHLSRSEVALEFRFQEFATPIADGPGSYQVDAQGNLVSEPPYSKFDSDSSGLSFLSYTYPRGGFAFGLFRAEVARFSISALTDLVTGPTQFRDISAQNIQADLTVVQYGGSAAWRASDEFWIGGSVTFQQIDFQAHQLERRDTDLQWGQRAGADDQGVSGTLGILWMPAERWRIGAAFRGGAEFDAEYSFTCGTRNDAGGARPGICRQQQIADGQPVPSLSGHTKFKLPDVYSAGVGFELTEGLTFSVQYDRVLYSQMVDGLRDSLTVADNLSGYSIEDAGDVHLGMEWLRGTGGSRMWALRAGGWLEAAHSLRYEAAALENREEFAVALFSTPIDDVWHYTGGFGVTLGKRLQLDVAADLSTYRDTYLLSTVVRF